MNFELRHLKAFRAVAQNLNFRRASEQLGVAQSALSRTIKHLEEAIGLTLFERTTRVTQLTEAGQDFLVGVIDILNRLDNAIEGARLVQDGVIGEIRVGYNDFAMSGLLPEIVRRFREHIPEIAVKLVESTSPKMLEMLLDGDIEVGFHLGMSMPADLQYMTIRQERLVSIVPTSHPLAEQKVISIAQLANEDFIMGRWEMWSSFHRIIKDICRSYGFQPRIIQEAEHSDGIMGLIAAGLGVTIFVDSQWIRVMEGIAVRPLHDESSTIATFASWRNDRRTNTGSIDALLKITNEVVEHRGKRLEELVPEI